jgi:hypothetical protein
VDSEKILFGKARPQTAFIKAKMNLNIAKFVDDMFAKYPKSLIQQTSSVEIIL